MGIVVDLTRSRLSASNPPSVIPMGAISNRFLCIMHQFMIQFGFRFDPNPARGIGGRLAAQQSYQIGVVQNVIFEKMRFEYEDGSVFRTDNSFQRPILDSAAQMYRPFYHDPVYRRGCEINHVLQCSRYLTITQPVVNVYVTANGYGELLDPWHPSGVRITNNPTAVDLNDNPIFGARLRLRNGAVVIRAERIVSFQSWLVAKTVGQLHVLAHMQPFSLVFWLTLQPPALSIQTPTPQFAFYGVNGILRQVHRSRGRYIAMRTVPQIQARLGNGGRNPVLQGQTANERGLTWLRTNGLLV